MLPDLGIGEWRWEAASERESFKATCKLQLAVETRLLPLVNDRKCATKDYTVSWNSMKNWHMPIQHLPGHVVMALGTRLIHT